MKTTKCGLFVSVVNPFLAATPGRVLCENTILEVKCPYSARDRDVTLASIPYLKHSDDGALYPDLQHSYCYQLQGQLYCSNRRLCYFVVYSRKSMRVITVEYNQQFVDNMITQLQDFYSNFFKVAMIERFLYKDYYSYSFKYK